MSNPNVAVAVRSLVDEAGVWHHNSEQLAKLVAMADGLRMTRLEAGIFQWLVDPYTHLINVVTARCREGAGHADEIAAALRQIADVYASEELANIHSLLNLY